MNFGRMFSKMYDREVFKTFSDRGIMTYIACFTLLNFIVINGAWSRKRTKILSVFKHKNI